MFRKKETTLSTPADIASAGRSLNLAWIERLLK
jgi:hypothetical protein